MANKEKNIKKKDGKYYLDFTFNKKRIRRFGGYTKEQARNNLAKLRLELLNEKMGFKKPGNGEPVPFKEFADYYLKTYSKQNKKSWKRDELSLKSLKNFFKNKNIQNITAADIEHFKAERKTHASKRRPKNAKKLPITNATVNRELTCLKTLLKKAVEWGKLENNPAETVKKLREKKQKMQMLSAAEADKLIEFAGDDLKPVLIIALNSGMRKGEILSLKWDDVDMKKGFIRIAETKSGKSRNVPINTQVYDTLKKCRNESAFVFYNPETRNHIKDVKTAFNNACERANIKGLRFHDLRHTAASWMVEAGVDLVTVSKILGHSSIEMTMRYAHPTDENMRRAVEKLAAKTEKRRQKVDTIKIHKPINNRYYYN
jgi:integrase